MDWWRAKLVLMATLLGLNGFLLWQIARLLPPHPGSAQPAAESFIGEGTPVLPLLTVRTENPQDVAPRLFHSPWTCANMAAVPLGGRGAAGGIRCHSTTATLDQWGGLLIFRNPRRIVGARLHRVAAAVAGQWLQAVAPHPSSTLGLSGGLWNASGHDRVFSSTEVYAGDILFNGTIQISVAATGITLRRFWLRVEPNAPHPAGQQIISAYRAVRQATLALGAVATPAAGQQSVELGYYFPNTEPPGVSWTVNPVWRIRDRQGTCFYVNADDGSLEAPSGERTQPQPC